MVEETRRFDIERGVGSTHFVHFWLVSEGDLECLLALAGQYKPLAGFLHKLYEVTVGLQSRAPPCFVQGMQFIHTSTP